MLKHYLRIGSVTVGSTWLVSDTHFDHAFVSKLRGFDSKDEHDRAIIKNWNNVVNPEDTVWHLGDVGMGSLKRFSDQVSELNGTINLVLGNHDEVSSIHRGAHKHQREWMQSFNSIQQFARIKTSVGNVLLSHYPYSGDHTQDDRFDQYRLRELDLPIVHGHTHSDNRGGGMQVCVCLEAWNLTPARVDQVEKLLVP